MMDSSQTDKKERSPVWIFETSRRDLIEMHEQTIQTIFDQYTKEGYNSMDFRN